MKKLLMVCMGNICRSPMAHAVAHKLAEDSGLSRLIRFDSAGTHAPLCGPATDPRANAALLRRGYAPTRMRARKVTLQDFQCNDQILAMDLHNLHALQRICPPEHGGKLRLFLDNTGGQSETEVPDPYYGNTEGFERVLDLCESGVWALIRQWERKGFVVSNGAI